MKKKRIMWENVWPNWITLQGRQGEPGGEGQPGHPGMPGFKGSKVRLHYQVIFFPPWLVSLSLLLVFFHTHQIYYLTGTRKSAVYLEHDVWQQYVLLTYFFKKAEWIQTLLCCPFLFLSGTKWKSRTERRHGRIPDRLELVPSTVRKQSSYNRWPRRNSRCHWMRLNEWMNGNTD